MTIEDGRGPAVDLTALLAVHGSIRPHPWMTATDHDQDAYSLFHARATAMGWTPSPPPAGSGGGGLWGIGEADQEWSVSAAAVRLAWFQVGLGGGGSAAMSLVPLLRCAVDTVERAGEADISAFQMLLSPEVGGSVWRHVLSCLNWFRGTDVRARTSVKVTVDAGTVGELELPAEEVLRQIGKRHTRGFEVATCTVDAREAVLLEPVMAYPDLDAAAGIPITFDAAVPEWSSEAVGILVAMLLGAFHEAGERRSLRVNVGRVGNP